MKAEQGSETGCLPWPRRRLEVSAIVLCDSAKTDAPSSPRLDFIQQTKNTLPGRRGWALPLDVQGCRSAHRRCAARSPKVRQKAMDEYFQSGLCSFDSELAMSYIFGCCCGCIPAAYIRWHLLFYCVGCSHGTTLRPQRERNQRVRSRWSGVNSQAPFSAISRCSKSLTKCQRIGDAHIWFAAPDA